ncbi:MAG: tetratricopeptide repeat protein [Polyangiales bacterium]
MDDETPMDDLTSRLQEASATPHDESLWDAAEEIARAEERPEEVFAAYRAALLGAADADSAVLLGQRAIAFHDEWSADSDALAWLLDRVLLAAPHTDWAFERLSMLYTVGERWDSLLELYDRALEALSPDDTARRRELLDEASDVAKDFAGKPERSIKYLEAQLEMEPGDVNVARSLERLYERAERHRDLIALWSKRIDFGSEAEALETRGRIAALWLEPIGDFASALAAIEDLIQHGGDDESVEQLLERVAAGDDPAAAHGAVRQLRARYDAAGRDADAMRLLLRGLEVAGDDGARAAIRRELADRLLAAGDDDAAVPHLAALLALDPHRRDDLERLQEVTDRTGRHRDFAAALAAAADGLAQRDDGDQDLRLALLVQAADAHCDVLEDAPGAISLYARVLATPEARDDLALTVSRRLSRLLEESGREAELLDVLIRRASLEPDASLRRSVRGQAAELAARRGEGERALSLWSAVLREDPADAEALDARVTLLETEARWEELVAALRDRAAHREDPALQRADLVAAARAFSDRLGRVDGAIAEWESVRDRFGEDDETIDALGDLFARAERWDDLLALLSRTADAAEEPARRAQLRALMGDVVRDRVGDAQGALARYREALGDDPANATARAGAAGLLDDASVRDAAVALLAEAYAQTDDWALRLGLLEHRLAAAETERRPRAAHARGGLAARAPRETLGGPPRRAASLAAVTPTSRTRSRDELERLGEVTGEWSPVVEAYRAAIEGLADDPARSVRLTYVLGLVLEQKVDDLSGALAAFSVVAAADRGDLDAARAAARVAALSGDDASLADTLVATATQVGALPRSLARTADDALSTAAESTPARWDSALQAIEARIQSAELAPELARALEAQVAAWHRDRREDMDAAEAALRRAVAHDRSDIDTLRMLVGIQRDGRSESLVETLLVLADAEFAREAPRVSLDALNVLHEAAGVTLTRSAETSVSLGILERLQREALARWNAAVDDGEDDLIAREHIAWALQQRVALLERDARYADAVEALESAAAARSFLGADARALRHRAAELLTEHLDGAERAMEIYREVIDAAPSDARAIAALASLYEAAGLREELLELRRHELSLARETPERLGLRLEIARILAETGDDEGRVEALEANIEESPGHAPSVEALAEVLEGAERFTELHALLSVQAEAVAAQGDDAAFGTSLWARAARVAEEGLKDTAQAIAAWEKVAEAGDDPEALDALARLHAARGEQGPAAGYLRRRLASAEGDARRATVVALAKALVATQQAASAKAVLEEALGADPEAEEVRELLAERYRAAEQWDALAELLSAETPPATLAALREAAEVLVHRLDDPSRAVAVLERAAALAPDDRGVRTCLAEALRSGGQLDAARAILDELLAGFGRHRPAERAGVHYQLALIAQARGETSEALAQLDLASKIDMAHAGIFKLLGDLARDAGMLDRAERAYRALLMIVRRHASSDPEATGPSEVLWELHGIATTLGQADRASETLESAFDTAARSDLESVRFGRALRAAGRFDLLLRCQSARLNLEHTPEEAAEILKSMAMVLELALDQPEEALSARLRALACTPTDMDLHNAVLNLARELKATSRYLDTLSEVAAKLRDEGDLPMATTLWLRLGRLLEEPETEDLPRAAAAYVSAEAAAEGDARVEAWHAMDRVCGAIGDAAGQRAALRNLVDHEGEDREGHAWRLAALDLASSDERDRDEGVDWLSWVLERAPDAERALGLLRACLNTPPLLDSALSLYERLAREQGDSARVLDALNLRASQPDVSMELLREGVELARGAGDEAAARALLLRAVEVARSRETPGEAVWAMVALAGQARAAESFGDALAWLQEAERSADPDEARRLALETAALAAGPVGDHRLAAEIYQRLHAQDFTDREVWEPLLGVYRAQGDFEAMERLIEGTVSNVYDRETRNALRMQWVPLILRDPSRTEEAIRALRDVLDEDPEDNSATAALADLFAREGRNEDLADLLMRQFDAARDRNDVVGTAAMGTRLAALLAPTRREGALDVLRLALEVAPKDRGLLRAAVALFQDTDDQRERADIMEHLLAVETGAEAGALSRSLAALRGALYDDAGVERALVLGFRAQPLDDELRGALEHRFNARDDAAALADLSATWAEAQVDPGARAGGYRHAAALRRDRLGDADTAAALLARARESLPDDLTLLDEQVRALAMAGRHADAAGVVTEAIERKAGGDSAEADLRRLRAAVNSAAGDDAAAVQDLEQAFALAGEPVAAELVGALDRTRLLAAGAGDALGERALTLRLIEVLPYAGEPEAAYALLHEWVQRAPDDVDALRLLADAQAAGERWDEAAATLSRLAEHTDGDARAEATTRLADACERAGRPGDAMPALARVAHERPDDDALQGRLRALYESMGMAREAAALWEADALRQEDEGARFERLRRAGEILLDAASAPAEAARVLAVAHELRPADHDALVLYADALAGADRLEEASQVLNDAINGHRGRRSKELAVLQHRMGRLAYAAGDQAVELAWLNAALDSDMQNGQVASELAEVAMETENYEVAIKALRAVTLMKTPGPLSRAQAFLRQGQIAQRQGDPRKAAFLARKALSEDAELEEAQAFLQSLEGA